MYDLDITRKFNTDDLSGVFTYKGVELRANIDAMSVMEAIAYMDDFEKAMTAAEKNPENPVLKRQAEKAALRIYEAICLIYNKEERMKIRTLNPTTEDLGELVSKAINLFNKRETETNRKN